MSKKEKIEKSQIDNIIENTFEHIKDIVDANTVVGKIIELGKNMYLIPVSKISVGLISGGGSMPKGKEQNVSAGSGMGFNIVPIGFVAVSNLEFKFISVNSTQDMSKNILDLMFKLYENYVSNKKDISDEKE